MDTSPACRCAALSAGRFLMPCIPLGPPASTQVPQSRVSPVLDPAGYSSRCFCPLQNFLCPIPCSSRTPFLKLRAPARCDFLWHPASVEDNFSTSMQWPLTNSLSRHLLQWLYSRSWTIAHLCRWRPQNSRQTPSVSHWYRISVISPSFSESSPALSKEAWVSV